MPKSRTSLMVILIILMSSAHASSKLYHPSPMSLTQIFDRMVAYRGAVIYAIQMFCYMTSMIIAADGVINFLGYVQNPRQRNLITPLLLMFTAVLFLVIPIVFNVVIHTAFEVLIRTK